LLNASGRKSTNFAEPRQAPYFWRRYTAAMRMVIGAVVALVVSACGLVQAEGKSGPACKADSDCVLVPTDCCGCNNGGKQKAIPARAKASYERARQARCADTMCAAVVSTDSSCAATTAVCKEGQCSLASSR
jgi:hypothetical protein